MRQEIADKVLAHDVKSLDRAIEKTVKKMIALHTVHCDEWDRLSRIYVQLLLRWSRLHGSVIKANYNLFNY